MIINKEKTVDKKMLFNDLEMSTLQFYCCGSRFHGFQKETSDYDYFISKDDLNYTEKLEKLHFLKSERTDDYGVFDVNTVEIWYSYSNNFHRQVMVVRDVKA